MSPDEQAKLERDRRTLARQPLDPPKREPLEGHGELPLSGWSLVTSRPQTAEESAAIDERARAEAGHAKGEKKPRKRKG